MKISRKAKRILNRAYCTLAKQADCSVKEIKQKYRTLRKEFPVYVGVNTRN